jgi:hypothetical protein
LPDLDDRGPRRASRRTSICCPRDRALATSTTATRWEPLIEIFWNHPKTKELVSPYAEPVEQGQHDPDLHVIDSGTLHMNLWNTVKNYHPDLKRLKYDQVPRVRVFFNKRIRNFMFLVQLRT